MGSARYIIADVFEALESLPDNSVDLVFSSPPFLALRSYLPADHPNKAKEIGSEATPADFLDTLLDVVEACDRVLAPHGSLCFELGDSFSGSGGAGGDYMDGGLHDGQNVFGGTAVLARDRQNAWPLPKSLCMLPTLFSASLAYGYNLLRPERTTPRWRIRNVVVWARPNPPVGALGDKFRPATSYLTVACKSDKRWFDLDAVRDVGGFTRTGRIRGADVEQSPETRGSGGRGRLGTDGEQMEMAAGCNPAGAPPLDYWEIPTQPYPGAHYATFPDKLVVKPVKAMCPSSVCRTCGEPRRRLTEATAEYAEHLGSSWADRDDGRTKAAGTERNSHSGQPVGAHITAAQRETTGWTDCGHNDWRAGVTLDPFAGSGTTLAVATGHGRDAIGIDLDSRNAELALERVGPLFLTVETLEGTEPFSPPAEDVESDVF